MATQAELKIQRLADKLEALQQDVKGFARLTRQQLLFQLASYGLRDRLKVARTVSKIRRGSSAAGKAQLEREEFLYKSLKTRVKQKDGNLEGIRFSFARHGIFFEHGVGRSRGIGSGNTKPNPWLSVVLPKAIEELADLLEKEYGDIALSEIVINIPGIITTIK